MKSGFIDGIMNVDDMLNSTLDGIRVFEVNPKSKLHRLRKALGLAGLIAAE